MDFRLTPQQRDLTDTARRFLAANPAPGWAELTALGWCDPELELVDLALLAEEGGRALLAGPWPVTAAALPAGAPGPVTFADGARTCHATTTPHGWRLHGHLPTVVDLVSANEILVVADSADGVAVFAARTADVTGVTHQESIDETRPLSEVRFRDTPARPLAGDGLAATLPRRVTVLAACEGVGVGDHALTLAVEHARTRVQFGRPIGSYQAVAHRLAEVYADLELARSLAYVAAADPDPTATAAAAHAARLSAVTACEVAIQTCGGMGVTWEFPLHRWYRRALWLDARLAAAPDPLDVVAAAVLDQGERDDTGPALVPADPR